MKKHRNGFFSPSSRKNRRNHASLACDEDISRLFQTASEITGCGITRKGLYDLLGCLLSRGMPGHVEVRDFSTFISEDDEHKKHSDDDGRDRELINRNHVFDMVVRERPPSLRWRVWMARHVFRNFGLGELNTQLAQLTMDPWSAPSDVGRLYLSDELAYCCIDRRAADATATTFPTPVASEAFAVSTNDSIGVQCVQHRPPSIDVRCE